MSNGTIESRGLRSLNDRALSVLIYGLSLVVVALVVILMIFPRLLVFEGLDVSALPRVHAILNGSCAVLLVVGFLQIRKGRVGAHRAFMAGAFVLSCVFLISYVVYHSQAHVTTFGGEGLIRPVYFATLISHIVLAPVVLPLALFTLTRAFRGEFDRHRRVARWTLPLWLYTSVTGVLVYLMMAPYYG
jgi:putative membrane protein